MKKITKAFINCRLSLAIRRRSLLKLNNTVLAPNGDAPNGDDYPKWRRFFSKKVITPNGDDLFSGLFFVKIVSFENTKAKYIKLLHRYCLLNDFYLTEK